MIYDQQRIETSRVCALVRTNEDFKYLRKKTVKFPSSVKTVKFP